MYRPPRTREDVVDAAASEPSGDGTLTPCEGFMDGSATNASAVVSKILANAQVVETSHMHVLHDPLEDAQGRKAVSWRAGGFLKGQSEKVFEYGRVLVDFFNVVGAGSHESQKAEVRSGVVEITMSFGANSILSP